jgi:hypothetical protein
MVDLAGVRLRRITAGMRRPSNITTYLFTRIHMPWDIASITIHTPSRTPTLTMNGWEMVNLTGKRRLPRCLNPERHLIDLLRLSILPSLRLDRLGIRISPFRPVRLVATKLARSPPLLLIEYLPHLEGPTSRLTEEVRLALPRLQIKVKTPAHPICRAVVDQTRRLSSSHSL